MPRPLKRKVKRVITSLSIDPRLLQHCQSLAAENGKTFPDYIEAALLWAHDLEDVEELDNASDN